MKDPKSIAEIMNKSSQDPARGIEIQNPALTQYRKLEVEKVLAKNKKVAQSKLWIRWKVPKYPNKPCRHERGDVMMEKLKVKYNFQATREVEALEFYLERVLQFTAHAIIYDNRPNTLYPVYKEWINGVLKEGKIYGYWHEKPQGKILPLANK